MYLVDHVCVGTVDLDGVRGELGIQNHRAVQCVRDEGRVDFPLGEDPRVSQFSLIPRSYIRCFTHLSDEMN